MGETLTLQQLRNNSYHLVIRSSLLAIQSTLSLQQTMLQSDHATFTDIKSTIASQNMILQNTTKTLVEYFSKISSFQPPPLLQPRSATPTQIHAAPLITTICSSTNPTQTNAAVRNHEPANHFFNPKPHLISSSAEPATHHKSMPSTPNPNQKPANPQSAPATSAKFPCLTSAHCNLNHNYIRPRVERILVLRSDKQQQILVTVGNGEELQRQGASRKVPVIIGENKFIVDFNLLYFSEVDAVFGIQRLENLGLITMDHKFLTMSFVCNNKSITLIGINAPSSNPEQISPSQLRSLSNTFANSFYLQFESNLGPSPLLFDPATNIHPDIQHILAQFLSSFTIPPNLPPHRDFNHNIFILSPNPQNANASPLLLTFMANEVVVRSCDQVWHLNNLSIYDDIYLSYVATTCENVDILRKSFVSKLIIKPKVKWKDKFIHKTLLLEHRVDVGGKGVLIFDPGGIYIAVDIVRKNKQIKRCRSHQMESSRKVFDGITIRNMITWNTLVYGYSLNFDFEGAIDAFRQIDKMGPKPNAITWTIVMSALTRCEKHKEVKNLFNEMRSSGVHGTPTGIVVVLSMYSYFTNDALLMGKRIHGSAFKLGFDKYLFVGNSLINMYGKLGCHNEVEVIFVEMKEKSLVSWNALIFTYAASGLYIEAYYIFSKLENSNDLKPNVVSWSSLIEAFSLAHMPESSLDMFQRVKKSYVDHNSITITTIHSLLPSLSFVIDLIAAALISIARNEVNIRSKGLNCKGYIIFLIGLDESKPIIFDLRDKMEFKSLFVVRFMHGDAQLDHNLSFITLTQLPPTYDLEDKVDFEGMVMIRIINMDQATLPQLGAATRPK